MYNNGCGLGFDLRESGTGRYELIGTLNGNATIRAEWTFLHTEFVIPARNSSDAPVAKTSYWAKDENGNTVASSTGGGARWGRSQSSDQNPNAPNLAEYYKTSDFPAEMKISTWFHNWHSTMAYCELKDPRVAILPK